MTKDQQAKMGALKALVIAAQQSVIDGENSVKASMIGWAVINIFVGPVDNMMAQAAALVTPSQDHSLESAETLLQSALKRTASKPRRKASASKRQAK